MSRLSSLGKERRFDEVKKVFTNAGMVWGDEGGHHPAMKGHHPTMDHGEMVAGDDVRHGNAVAVVAEDDDVGDHPNRDDDPNPARDRSPNPTKAYSTCNNWVWALPSK